MNRLLSIAFMVLLTACGPRVDATQQARTQMVGMERADLVSCAGEPSRRSVVGGTEVLTYVRTENQGGVTRSCRTDVRLYRNHVQHVSYEGMEHNLFGPETPCVNIVQACLR